MLLAVFVVAIGENLLGITRLSQSLGVVVRRVLFYCSGAQTRSLARAAAQVNLSTQSEEICSTLAGNLLRFLLTACCCGMPQQQDCPTNKVLSSAVETVAEKWYSVIDAVWALRCGASGSENGWVFSQPARFDISVTGRNLWRRGLGAARSANAATQSSGRLFPLSG